MTGIRAPSWIELASALPLEAEPGVTSAATITSLSGDTLRREYPEFIIQLSPRRQGMKLKHALLIAGTVIDDDLDLKVTTVPKPLRATGSRYRADTLTTEAKKETQRG